MTHEALRNTWNSEQWVIDRLVEAVESGNASAKERLGKHLVIGYAAHDWHHYRVAEAGPFLLRSRADLMSASADDVVRAFDEWDIGYTGWQWAPYVEGPMTPEDISEGRKVDVDPSSDDEPRCKLGRRTLWAAIEVRHSPRGRCCLAVMDWDGPEQRFVAAYLTAAEARSAVKEIGFVSVADYFARQ